MCGDYVCPQQRVGAESEEKRVTTASKAPQQQTVEEALNEAVVKLATVL